MPLYLVPTPIVDDGDLDGRSQDRLSKLRVNDQNVLLAVEELKAARRRWALWGLDRSFLNTFLEFNEHTVSTQSPVLRQALLSGKDVYLMSDGGLPAFCDPGQELVNWCHLQKIKVTSFPFDHSVSLALALSGFDHREFVFNGFLPRKEEQRVEVVRRLVSLDRTVVLMDTPYRMEKLLSDLKDAFLFSKTERILFLATNLGYPFEELFRGRCAEVIHSLGENKKREFVLILGPQVQFKES